MMQGHFTGGTNASGQTAAVVMYEVLRKSERECVEQPER